MDDMEKSKQLLEALGDNIYHDQLTSSPQFGHTPFSAIKSFVHRPSSTLTVKKKELMLTLTLKSIIRRLELPHFPNYY